jgi:hypothetical protein
LSSPVLASRGWVPMALPSGPMIEPCIQTTTHAAVVHAGACRADHAATTGKIHAKLTHRKLLRLTRGAKSVPGGGRFTGKGG